VGAMVSDEIFVSPAQGGNRTLMALELTHGCEGAQPSRSVPTIVASKGQTQESAPTEGTNPLLRVSKSTVASVATVRNPFLF
jgi:hypothetical protein